MVKKEYSFELKSNLSELDNLCRHLETFGQKTGLSKKFLFEINLVLDELFTNIISYGFDDDFEHVIKITMTPDKKGLCWISPLMCTPHPKPGLRLRKKNDIKGGFMINHEK